MKRALIVGVVLVGLSSALAGCGSGSGGGSSGNQPGGGSGALNPTQAQQLGTTVVSDVSNALAGAIGNVVVPLDIGPRDHIRLALQRNSHADTAPNPEPEVVSCSVSSCSLSGTYTCPDGGSIAVSGSFTASTNSASGTITETPSSCSDGTLVINGNPDVTVAVQGNDNGITSTVSLSLNGDVSYSPVQPQQFPAGSCAFNVTANATVNDSSHSMTSISVSGTVCGETIQ